MTVTLDAPPQPMWRITCDHPGCGARLYVGAMTPQGAADRARLLYDWAGDDERQYCRTHKERP